MTDKQWEIFTEFKKDLQIQVEKWTEQAPELADLQKAAAVQTKTPPYPFETPVVYNRDLDKITKQDDIHLIVIGDNPGKDEQLAVNNRYLCGQAGKLAEGFFKRNPNLNTDFRKNVIILNKTPIHSAKTNHLKIMMKQGGQKIIDLVQESQLWMAERTAKLHWDLCSATPENAFFEDSNNTTIAPELWLVGYSELKEKGFFVPYRNKLLESYKNFEKRGQTPIEDCPGALNTPGVQGGQTPPSFWSKVYVFQHFSMNRFSIDLRDFQQQKGTDPNNSQINLNLIHQLGTLHRKEIFGE